MLSHQSATLAQLANGREATIKLLNAVAVDLEAAPIEDVAEALVHLEPILHDLEHLVLRFPIIFGGCAASSIRARA